MRPWEVRLLDFKSVSDVLRKELREATRDRNLLLNVVLMPLFLYPALGFGVFQTMQVIQGISEQRPTIVAVAADVPRAVADSIAAFPNHRLVPVPPELATDSFSAAEFRAWRKSHPAAEVPHAVLQWRSVAAGDSGTVVHDASQERSVAALRSVRSAVDDWRRDRALEALERTGLGRGDLDLWELEEEDTSSAVQRGQELMAVILPMILLLMLTMGTFAAVLDTVVGERERGTLETLLVSPVGRAEVIFGKYLFVITSSLLAFVLNLASMSLFVVFLFRLLDLGDTMNVAIEPTALLLMMAAAVLLSALLAAVLMVLVIPARTYREGQATLNPFFLLTMVPGLIVVSSHDSFDLGQAAIPVLNAVALFKSSLRGEFPPGPILMTFAVLALSAALALAFASRFATREDLLLEPRGSLRELLTGKMGGRS